VSKPAVIFGGPSPEHDVSILTGLQAVRALTAAGTACEAIYWAKSAAFFLVDSGLEAPAFLDGPPRGARELRLIASPGGGFGSNRTGVLGKDRPLEISAVVNCCHGGPGEDGTLQAALDLAGLAYTGPTAAGAQLGMDKLAFSGLMATTGLPALPRVLVGPHSPVPAFDSPYILKPRFGGSSIGIEVMEDWASVVALASRGVHYRRGAVAEPFSSEAIDLNIAARSWPELQLSLIEKPLRSGGQGDGRILGYGDKYLGGGEGMASAPREMPAQLPDPVEKSLRDAARTVAGAAGLRGVCRIDFLYDGTDWWVNEINTVPGSMARYLWVESSAVPFAKLLSDMIGEALERPTVSWDATGADGTALRSASSIASKLG
jgi:D-alanine-D-alanine ligase